MSDLRNRTACGRIGAFLARRARPIVIPSLSVHSWDLMVVTVFSYLAGLVLRDLVVGVLLALLALAVGPARLREVDL